MCFRSIASDASSEFFRKILLPKSVFSPLSIVGAVQALLCSVVPSDSSRSTVHSRAYPVGTDRGHVGLHAYPALDTFVSFDDSDAIVVLDAFDNFFEAGFGFGDLLPCVQWLRSNASSAEHARCGHLWRWRTCLVAIGVRCSLNLNYDLAERHRADFVSQRNNSRCNSVSTVIFTVEPSESALRTRGNFRSNSHRHFHTRNNAALSAPFQNSRTAFTSM